MYKIILNPLANNKKSSSCKNYFIEKYGAENVEIFDILEIEDIRQFVLSNMNDIIVIAGGDGTISNFINDVYGLENLDNVFYYPCGSGNDFYNDVKDLPLFENVKDKLIPVKDFIKSLPVVTVNGIKKYFINGIGFGIDGYCCEQGDIIRANSEKGVNYTLIAIKGLLGKFKTHNAVVTVDGVTKEYKKVWLAPTMIGRYYGGGMKVTPNQDRFNPNKVVSSVVFHKSSVLKTLIIFPSIFSGKHIKYKKYFEVREGHCVTVEFEKPCALQIDGETYKNVTKYSVEYGK